MFCRHGSGRESLRALIYFPDILPDDIVVTGHEVHTLVVHLTEIFKYLIFDICLRSRPVDPNVVCQSVCP